MAYFDDEENVLAYEQMAEGPGGALLVATLEKHLAAGASVLELGMGPGRDLDRLLAAGYTAVGSDISAPFVERYRARRGRADCQVLDAVTIDTLSRFDAVYSNKVLHHLNEAELVASLERQLEVAKPNHLFIHSFWRGRKVEVHHGMLFTYWETEGLEAVLPAGLGIRASGRYSEIWEDDSLWVLFGPSSTVP
jgi:cyclopropane fatty-acyl-phospholipid synthase-like methyltransferase